MFYVGSGCKEGFVVWGTNRRGLVLSTTPSMNSWIQYMCY